MKKKKNLYLNTNIQPAISHINISLYAHLQERKIKINRKPPKRGQKYFFSSYVLRVERKEKLSFFYSKLFSLIVFSKNFPILQLKPKKQMEKVFFSVVPLLSPSHHLVHQFHLMLLLLYLVPTSYIHI